jgi:ferric-dicitrate binding protein FerR (iron transport regulator)
LCAARQRDGRQPAVLAAKLQTTAAALAELEQCHDTALGSTAPRLALLRVYARELRLDPEPLVRQALIAAERLPPAEEPPESTSSARATRRRWGTVAASLVVLFAFGVAAAWWLGFLPPVSG